MAKVVREGFGEIFKKEEILETLRLVLANGVVVDEVVWASVVGAMSAKLVSVTQGERFEQVASEMLVGMMKPVEAFLATQLTLSEEEASLFDPMVASSKSLAEIVRTATRPAQDAFPVKRLVEDSVLTYKQVLSLHKSKGLMPKPEEQFGARVKRFPVPDALSDPDHSTANHRWTCGRRGLAIWSRATLASPSFSWTRRRRRGEERSSRSRRKNAASSPQRSRSPRRVGVRGKSSTDAARIALCAISRSKWRQLQRRCSSSSREPG